jgi:hypothetical protein
MVPSSYERNILTTKTTNYFSLRAVSAEFQTSRSEARHQRMSYKLSLLDSYLRDLPSSAKIFHNVSRKKKQ